MNVYHLSKSIILNPVEESDLNDLFRLRQNHSAWQVISREQLQQIFEEKWNESGKVSRWTIRIKDRIYGEIGWKSYTPGSHIYLDLIIFNKEFYSLDLAKHLITPFVNILVRQFRIHTIRFSVLKPDTGLEKFLGTMHVRSLSARHIPARDYFPGGLVASYEVEADHLIHKYGNVKKILWKSFQFIPYKLLDTDHAPTDFKKISIVKPGTQESVELKSRQSLIDYLSSLPHILNVKTIATIEKGTFIKIGIAVIETDFPELLIWHPFMNTFDTQKTLFACVLDNLRHNPIVRSGFVYGGNTDRIQLLKTFNFILDRFGSDNYKTLHLETVSLPDKDELLKI